jgi:hypothetical protein
VKKRRRVVVTEEVVVWCVSVVVAGDGDDDRMGLLGETVERCLVSSCSLARSLFWLWLTPKRRSPARDEMVVGSLSACLPACLSPPHGGQ